MLVIRCLPVPLACGGDEYKDLPEKLKESFPVCCALLFGYIYYLFFISYLYLMSLLLSQFAVDKQLILIFIIMLDQAKSWGQALVLLLGSAGEKCGLPELPVKPLSYPAVFNSSCTSCRCRQFCYPHPAHQLPTRYPELYGVLVSLSDTKTAEYFSQQVIRSHFSGDFTQRVLGLFQFFSHKLARVRDDKL